MTVDPSFRRDAQSLVGADAATDRFHNRDSATVPLNSQPFGRFFPNTLKKYELAENGHLSHYHDVGILIPQSLSSTHEEIDINNS